MESPDGCNLHLSSLDSNSGPSAGLNPTGPQRTKRMRTSFKHHQLRTMKSYFAINQNPDAKDLKQLASKTGLSKRVLQVTHSIKQLKFNLLEHSSLQCLSFIDLMAELANYKFDMLMTINTSVANPNVSP